jgi:PKD repeat protein
MKRNWECLSQNYRPANHLITSSIIRQLRRPGMSLNRMILPGIFGDGTIINSNAPTLTHQYVSAGTYIVKLILNDTGFCNSPDSVVYTLRVASVLMAQFTTPPNGCSPYNAVFDNTSIGGQNFLWDFGDGTTSTEINPTHLYQEPGTYTVKLTASDNFTCNPTDDTSMIITVYAGPVSSFTYAPAVPKENTPYEFTNTSIGASNYKWEFGDGDTLLTTSMLPVSHIYNAPERIGFALLHLIHPDVQILPTRML